MTQQREQTPWDRTFDPIPDSIDSAIVAAGLDWEVIPKPAMFLNAARDETDEYIDLTEFDPDNPDLVYEVEPVANYFFNVRSDTGQPLGAVVTDRYSTFHNIQAFAWLSQNLRHGDGVRLSRRLHEQPPRLGADEAPELHRGGR